jgi:biopolymer transport protein ExbB/TolQ
MQALLDALYVISTALLPPVVIALLALFSWMLLLAGGFLREAFARRRVRRQIELAVEAARGGASAELNIWVLLDDAGSGLPKRFAASLGNRDWDKQTMEYALSRLEHDVTESVARNSFLTRVSPMLGLMGTLIPLGPALSGLASGNMQALTGNLVVAFTATVVGLLISAVSFGIGLARRTWYSRDLTDLEYIARRVASAENIAVEKVYDAD